MLQKEISEKKPRIAEKRKELGARGVQHKLQGWPSYALEMIPSVRFS